MKKMKILYLALDNVDYQGKSHEILLAEELARQGNEITLVCERTPFGYEENGSPENIQCYVMNINGELSWEQYDVLMSHKYDIAFASSVTGARWINNIAKKQKIPSVCQLLDIPVWRLRYKNWFEEWQYKLSQLNECTSVVANTKMTEKLIHKVTNNTFTKPIDIIYYGIASDNADKIQISEKKNQIVFVSGLRWYKGLDILLYSLATMKRHWNTQDGEFPKLIVVGVGDGTEVQVNINNNPIPIRYLDMITQLGIDVEFIGGVGDDEKFKIIKESKLAVYPDYSESITGMFPLESAYCGVPCLVGGMEINYDRFKNFALFIPEEQRFDTGVWASQIKRFLLDIKAEVTESQKKGILENRSFISHAKGLQEVFEKCLKKE